MLDAKASSVELHEFVSEKLAPVSGVSLPSQRIKATETCGLLQALAQGT